MQTLVSLMMAMQTVAYWLTKKAKSSTTTFGDVPLSLEYKLQVWDSPNSAGIVIDAVRAAKIALDRHLAGPVLAPSSYFMKSPAVQHEDGEARRLVEEFIKGEVEGTEEQLDADVAAAKAAGKDVWRA